MQLPATVCTSLVALRSLKIVSGGQTGADRAALDWAVANGVPHGGWCPKNRRAEDGAIPAAYVLLETPAGNYLQRTAWDARDADGTVVFSIAAALGGGSRKTVQLARKHARPCLHLSAALHGEDAPALLRQFIREHGVRVLNVAGSRASKEAGVGDFVRSVLDKAFAQP